MIHAKDYVRTARIFHKIFDLNINEYIDPFVTNDLMVGFDYVKFEQTMFERHSETRADGVSLQEVVNVHYGTRGVELIKSIL